MGFPIEPPIEPMLSKAAAELPEGDGWLFEPKWDGFRAIIFRDHDDVAIQSKAGQPLARYFPEVVEAVRGLKAKELVLDGEIVVPIEGRLSFDHLLQRIHPAEKRVRKLAEETPASYFAFERPNGTTRFTCRGDTLVGPNGATYDLGGRGPNGTLVPVTACVPYLASARAQGS